MYDAHANLASSLVVTPPSPDTSGTSLTVETGEGAYFPAVPFNCTLAPFNTLPTPLNAEIVRVTNITGDTFTITRAQEGTTAMPIAAGYYIGNSITAKTLTDIETQTASSTLTDGHIFVGSGANIATDVALSGDATLANTGALTVTGLNGTSLAGLATGILKNTTGTGVPSIAVAGDFPTLNQNTTGTAANATNIGITDDTTTNATMYPVWVTANTGNLPAKVTSTKLSFNPSTGVVSTNGLNILGTGTTPPAQPAYLLNLTNANMLISNNDVTTGYVGLGHSLRSGGRAQLWLNSFEDATGDESAEVLFGINTLVESNIRWTLSSRYEFQPGGHDMGRRFQLWEGPGNVAGAFTQRMTVMPGTGFVGFGTNDPDGPLETAIDGSSDTYNTSYNTLGAGITAATHVRRARGTQSAPSALVSGDALGGLYANGYAATGWSANIGVLRFEATENFTDTAQGTQATLAVTPNGSTTRATVLTVTSAGGAFTGTLSSSSTITGTQLISTIATGTAPLSITSTTVVGNLNVSQLLGGTWAVPGTIGSGTPNTIAGTTGAFSGVLSANSTTDSSSVSTGSIVSAGGIGVAKSMTVGGNINLIGTMSIDPLTGSSDATFSLSARLAGVQKLTQFTANQNGQLSFNAGGTDQDVVGQPTGSGNLRSTTGIKTATPSGGTAAAWKLGTYTAGAAVQAGKVRIDIAGTPYDLLTA